MFKCVSVLDNSGQIKDKSCLRWNCNFVSALLIHVFGHLIFLLLTYTVIPILSNMYIEPKKESRHINEVCFNNMQELVSYHII